MDYGRNDSTGGYLVGYTSAGSALTLGSDGAVTLTGTTYYFPLGSTFSMIIGQTSVAAVGMRWAAAVAATITLEDTCFPATRGRYAEAAGNSVTDYDETAGNWIVENPSTAYVSVVGTGNSATAATITAGGTNAGGAVMHVSGLGSLRARIKVAATVGGKFWICPHAKGR